ncbi:MAG: hypothetical protein EOP19_11465 [Hyphomicrobiales bacterium]|nr:MAG: hypothetical protein EOP19_11465 [Hyphomicrobiales bacterium]
MLRLDYPIAGYGRAREPTATATAILPLGRTFAKTGAASAFAAETEALRACTEKSARDGATGSCLLHAAGNTVVLPGQHTAPLATDPAEASTPASRR